MGYEDQDIVQGHGEDAEMGSPTPALDQIMAENYAADVEGIERESLDPEDYFAAALEAYNLMGQALSEAGSMYLLVGSMLGAITPAADTEVTNEG